MCSWDLNSDAKFTSNEQEGNGKAVVKLCENLRDRTIEELALLDKLEAASVDLELQNKSVANLRDQLQIEREFEEDLFKSIDQTIWFVVVI